MNEIDFRKPSEEEHRKVVKGLWPFNSKGFCLRLGYHVLILIATQAFILWNAYSQVLPREIFLVAVAAGVSHLPIKQRMLFSAYTKKLPQPYLMFGIFSFLLDGFLVLSAYMVRSWEWIVYIPAAIVITGWHFILGTKIYRNERLMHRAVNGRNYKIIEARISNKTKDFAGHRETLVNLFSLEAATENNDQPLVTFEVYILPGIPPNAVRKDIF